MQRTSRSEAKRSDQRQRCIRPSWAVFFMYPFACQLRHAPFTFFNLTLRSRNKKQETRNKNQGTQGTRSPSPPPTHLCVADLAPHLHCTIFNNVIFSVRLHGRGCAVCTLMPHPPPLNTRGWITRTWITRTLPRLPGHWAWPAWLLGGVLNTGP